MGHLFKAFLFKLKRDLVFRITLIVGGSLSLLIAIALGVLDVISHTKLLNGLSMLLLASSPLTNYGIFIVIDVLIFICAEFAHGTIRNKIIAGNSKLKIFWSLCASALVYAFVLYVIFVGVCVAIGSIFGGFSLSNQIISLASLTGTVEVDAKYVIETVTMNVLVFFSLVMFAIFLATAFRTLGPAIPIIILLILFGTTITQILLVLCAGNSVATNIIKIIDPFTGLVYLDDFTFTCCVINNTVYTALFTTLGCLLFRKRDVK